jgi:hypothetical protein
MRRSIAVLFTFLLVCSIASAAPQTFVGGSLGLNIPFHQFSSARVTPTDGGPQAGLGGECELGLRSAKAELYFGYRFGHHDAQDDVRLMNNTNGHRGGWTFERGLMGFRLINADRRHSMLQGYIGGGVSVGRTRVSVSGPSTQFAPESQIETAEYSTTSPGWFAEAGVRLRLTPDAALDIGAATQQFHASFTGPLYEGAFNVSLVSIQSRLTWSL